MRKTGELVQWNNKGGYGFARDEDGRDYYVHISKVDGGRPRLGDRVEFTVTAGRKGRPSAIEVTIVETKPLPPPPAPELRPQANNVSRFKIGLRTLAATLMTLLILWAIGTQQAPVWLGLLYAAMGTASALLYRFDKLYAMGGQWRVSETNLHVVDLACGIIGGLSAQEVYRHKTVKPRFVGTTWLIALLHTIVLAAIAFGWWPQLG